MILYVDNNEFVFGRSKKNDVFCIGGFSCELTGVKKIEKTIETIKHNHGISPDLPFKWNLKDPRIIKLYRLQGKQNLLKQVIKESQDIREEIFRELPSLDISIIVCGIRQLGRAVSKEKVCGWGFTNLLQRFGLSIQRKSNFNFIVLDWDSELRDKYCQIYQKAYYEGTGLEGEEYFSGDIKSLPITFPYISFAVSVFNPLLQLADLLMGCTGSFFEYCFKGKNKTFVYRFFPLLKDCFRKSPSGDILKWGIIFKPLEDEEIIREKLNQLG